MADPIEDIIGNYRAFAAQQRDRLATMAVHDVGDLPFAVKTRARPDELDLEARAVAAMDGMVILDGCAVFKVTDAVQQNEGSASVNLKQLGLIFIGPYRFNRAPAAGNHQSDFLLKKLV